LSYAYLAVTLHVYIVNQTCVIPENKKYKKLRKRLGNMECITFPSADCNTMRIEMLNKKRIE